MKTLEVDFLLYDPNSPQETRVTLRIPVAPTYAEKLKNGVCCEAYTALYNMAGALGFLNGCRGMPLRVREVDG